MDLQVWLHSFCPSTGLSIEPITSSLKKENICVAAFNDAPPLSPGIIVFEDVRPEICDFVNTYSRNGTQRILALAAGANLVEYKNAWQLLHAGASDVMYWKELSDAGAVIAARLKRWQAVDEIVDSRAVQNTMVGQSHVWRSVLRRIVEVARFTDAPVLLMGETGTGKELAAKLIHSLDPQRNNHTPVILDCTTIVPELSGSELFGHERGAFTGAVAARDGAFAQANKGTLFLDEVGELPLELQVQLLRILQEHTYKRVGSNVWRKSDFRLICATNRNLILEEMRGKFRRDLYYRIASWTIKLPPLRERTDDIIPLVNHFTRQARSEEKSPELDEHVRTYFLSRAFPGNVRDLKNLVFRTVARHVGPGPITIGDIPSEERPKSTIGAKNWCGLPVEQSVRRALATGIKLKEIKRTVEDVTLRIAVSDANDNLQHAANKLGISDRTLQKWRAKQRKCAEA